MPGQPVRRVLDLRADVEHGVDAGRRQLVRAELVRRRDVDARAEAGVIRTLRDRGARLPTPAQRAARSAPRPPSTARAAAARRPSRSCSYAGSASDPHAVRSASMVAVGTIPSTCLARSAFSVTRASACSFVRATYSASYVSGQPELVGNRPGVTPEHGVAEKTNRHGPDAGEEVERGVRIGLAGMHGLVEPRQSLRAQESRRQQLVLCRHLDPLTCEVEDGVAVDDESRHAITLLPVGSRPFRGRAICARRRRRGSRCRRSRVRTDGRPRRP